MARKSEPNKMITVLTCMRFIKLSNLSIFVINLSIWNKVLTHSRLFLSKLGEELDQMKKDRADPFETES